MTDGAFAGQLLVAAPRLRDPNFDRTVVLVLEHGDEGALGLVLNRPTDTDLFAALPRWERLAAPPTVLFRGGPVAPSAAIALGEASGGGAVEGWHPLFGDLGSVDLEREPDELGVPVRQVRVFAGYSGWGPGQLEGEVEIGAWYVVDALPGDALSERPAELWAEVLRRQGGNLGLVANFPADPSLN
jgi:putative transcriptional regulator